MTHIICTACARIAASKGVRWDDMPDRAVTMRNGVMLCEEHDMAARGQSRRKSVEKQTRKRSAPTTNTP